MQVTESKSEVRERVTEYMEQTFLITFGDAGMSPDTNLFVEGVIDSFGLVELVGFIESTFGVSFSDDDMLSPELNTLNGIIAMVEARR